MHRRFSLALALSILAALGGCASPFVAVQPEPKSGHFLTPDTLTPKEAKVSVPIANLDRQRFIVLSPTINMDSEKYVPFVKQMVENCGLHKLVGHADLENFVIANNLGDRIPSLNNRIGFHQLTRYIGEYLILQIDLSNTYGDWWRFTAVVYDPVSSKVKFLASKSAVNMFGLQKPLLLPVFNALKDWVDKSREMARLAPPEPAGQGI